MATDSSESDDDAEIQAIYRLELVESSREAYRARLRLFVNYLRRTDPDLVHGDATFDCTRLHLRQFELFLIGKQDDDRVGLDTLKNYRTALIYAFKEANVELPAPWRTKLKRFYRGLRRKEAQERQDGDRPLTTGKASLPHRLHVWLCEYFLRKGNVFAWAYLTLAWTSLCRAQAVADVKLVHLEPAHDALGLHVPKSKADQAGVRAAIGWQIFANPEHVEQCCVTALALLLVLDETRIDDGNKLFMGGSQDRRFAHDMEQALKTDEGKAKLAEFGRVPGSITPHSTRKGAAAFASNGTTHAPSFTAVTLRAGWSLGSILGRYFHFDASADAYLGRVLAGLNVMTPTFALLPPHFGPNTVSDAQLLACFPAFRDKGAESLAMLRFVLPSLLHHYDTLSAMLPKTHRVRSTRFFMDAALRKTLSSRVVTGLDSAHLTASGIPPHVLVLRQGATIVDRLDLLTAHLVPTASTVVSPTPAIPTITATTTTSTTPKTPSGFPVDFQLPIVSAFAAWRLLVRGNTSLGHPPYRLLSPKEFPNDQALRKRMSDWHYYFRSMAEKLGARVDDGVLAQLAADDDERDLSDLFHRAWVQFDFASLGGKTKARPDQWTFATAVLKMRELERGAGTLETHLAKAKPAKTKRTRDQRTPEKEKTKASENAEFALPRSPPTKLFAAPRKRDVDLEVADRPRPTPKAIPVVHKNKGLDYASFFQ